MALQCKLMFVISLVLLVFLFLCVGGTPSDIALDEKAKNTHRIDSLNILLYTFLLILTVVTIWLFKHRRVRFLHETGLAIFYGLVVGAIIHYADTDIPVSHQTVMATNPEDRNFTNPPDTLWLTLMQKTENKTLAYIFKGLVVDVEENEIDQKATFDPEIFFNIILPPIIFHAGYSLKRKYFFRNLGAIMTFAFLGTTVSCFAVGAIMYGFVQLDPYITGTGNEFTFLDTLNFGAIISATDPITILAIFHDLHVDVNLYAMVFGESVLNDAVAIVLSGAVENYGKIYQSGSGEFETDAFFKAFGEFVWVFGGSFLLGSCMGCATAILTKFTRIRDFPVLETSLFVLMSYSTFLISEAADLTGIVAVLFCGICQAHYTCHNLSAESRTRTKQLFDLVNFLAENFIFSYIGVSMFTFPNHNFDVGFICSAFLAVAVGRALNVYMLSFFLNLGRNQKIAYNFQHMLFFSGLRGAIAFALAIRNTVSRARQTVLTTTSLIVIVTVIICGGSTTQLLAWLGIPVGVEEETENLQYSGVRSVYNTVEGQSGGPNESQASHKMYEKSWLARLWHSFDSKYMKPFLTHSRPTLLETLPVCCNPLGRCLTTTEQLTQDHTSKDQGSDTDLCLEDNGAYGEQHRSQASQNELHDGDLGLGSEGGQQTRVRMPGPSGEDL